MSAISWSNQKDPGELELMGMRINEDFMFPELNQQNLAKAGKQMSFIIVFELFSVWHVILESYAGSNYTFKSPWKGAVEKMLWAPRFIYMKFMVQFK